MKAAHILISILFPFLLAGLSGCTSQAEKAPVIKNLTYAVQELPVHESGTANVTGTFDIMPGGLETSSVTTTVYSPQGKQVSTNTIDITDASMKTATALGFLAEISTTTKGEYTFHVSIKDSKGRKSNDLIGTVLITDVF